MRAILTGFAVALVCLGAPANAATFVKSLAGAPDPGASGNLDITFDDPLPAGIVFAPGSNYTILQGVVAHRGYNPAGDQTKYLVVPGTGTSGSATLDFSGLAGTISDFSFYWGSVDRANDLTITTSLGSLNLTGADILGAGYGSATSARGNRRAFFALASGETLKSITFSSPTGFELDDIIMNYVPATPAPEPATWMMLIAGFGIIGSAMRQQRKGGFALSPSV